MSYEYLNEDFDPQSLKVGQLRRILLENTVDVPPKAKKQSLVRIFNKEIVPRRNELREKYVNVKPNSRGIEKKTLKNLRKSNMSSPSSSSSVPSSPVKKTKKKRALEDVEGELVDTDDNNVTKKKKKSKNKIIEETESKPIVIDDEKNDDDKNFNSDKIITKSSHRTLFVKDEESAKQNRETNNMQLQGKQETTYVSKKIISPDLSKLNVSPEFAKVLKSATSQSTTPISITSENSGGEASDHVKEIEEIVDSNDEKEMDATGKEEPVVNAKNTKENDEIERNEDKKIETADPIDKGHLSSPFVDNERDHDFKQNENQKGERRLHGTKFRFPKMNLLKYLRRNRLTSKNENNNHIGVNKFQWPKIRFGKKISKVSQSQSKNKFKSKPKSKSRFNFKFHKLKNLKMNLQYVTLPRININRASIKHNLINLLIFSFITTPILFCLWYREQRIAIGFCGKELPFKELFPRDNIQPNDKLSLAYSKLSIIDSFLRKHFYPTCLLCPENAECFANMEIQCHSGFEKKDSLLSLNSIIPLSSYCIKDETKDIFIQKALKNVVHSLRKQNAVISCGKGVNSKDNGLQLARVYEIVFSPQYQLEWGDDEVQKVWHSFLEKVENYPDIILFNEEDATPYLRSTSEEFISLRCKYGNQLFEFYKSYKYYGIAICILFIVGLLIKLKVDKYIAERNMIDNYTKKAIEKLKKARESDQTPPFLHTLQLRDVILADVTDLNYRNKIWKKMLIAMEKDNKNITSSQMEINGEIIRGWMWNGDPNSNA